MAVGMGARQRIEIALGEQAAAVGDNSANDIGHGGALLQVDRIDVPAAIAGELETHAADPRTFQTEANDRADLIKVGVVIDGADESTADVVLTQRFQRLQFDFQQILAAQMAVDPIVQTVELQINLEAITHARQKFDQCRIVRQTNAVGIEHDYLNRRLVSVANHAVQIRMQSRFTAGELQHVRNAFQVHVAIHHASISIEIKVSAARPRFRKAHGTVQVAVRCDLDQRNAGVLFVFGTQPAVIGTAALDLGAVSMGKAGRLAQFMSIEISDIGTDKILDQAVFGAALAEVNAPVADDDLGID